MSAISAPALLVLHGVRVMGTATTAAVAGRNSLELADAEELLLDQQAAGWVTYTEFAGASGWSLTEAGRAEDARLLADELAQHGVRAVVNDAHDTFAELNTRLLRACTDWQIRPTAADPLAFNDHSDWRWDERVLERLASLNRRLGPLCATLTEALHRFHGYADRFSAALARAERGERSWVDSPEVDSCHTVWIQLHEDLLATLGLDRG